jgi:thiol-disulfide isomerase/thioredoxin
MSTRTALAALVVVTLVAGTAMLVSRSTEPERVRRAVGASAESGGSEPAAPSAPGPHAPPVDAEDWLNTEPLGGEDIAGRVVLYEFWTFACSNCQAVQPYIGAWWDRYRDDGLLVVTVHSPEFDYEADPANVAEYVGEEGVDWPVALDPEKKIWRRWDQRFWPTIYIHDTDGRRRHTHIGEGGYRETEDILRDLLGVDADSPRAEVET